MASQGPSSIPAQNASWGEASSQPKPDRKNSQRASISSEAVIEHQDSRQHDERSDDENTDSDPEDGGPPTKDTQNNQRSLSIEMDRVELLNAIKNQVCEVMEDFKEAHNELLMRCLATEEEDQNIFHWLADQLLPNSITDKCLTWLVQMVMENDPNILTRLTKDGLQENCLHLAVKKKRFNLVICLCQNGNTEALKKAISQGNGHDETCLHLAIMQSPPNLMAITHLLNKADGKVIAKQRSTKHSESQTEHLNTVLHDFVHINRCFVKGYRKILKRLIQECPEAMQIQNFAKETPFQFHLGTRQKNHPEWVGLEFATREIKTTGNNTQRGKYDTTRENRANTEQASVEQEEAIKQMNIVAEVGQLLLNEAFSQSTYEEACLCIYGEKYFDKAISFQPASPINAKIGESHPFLKFYPILSDVELILTEPGSVVANSHTKTQLPGLTDVSNHDDESLHNEWIDRMDSIRKVFTWFRKQKVQRILRLVVVDDATLPCSDETIEECIKDFDIRYLNWNKDDLCVTLLHQANLPNIQELWLSWSARNSVLYSWSCKERGLPSLKRLNSVHIKSKNGTESIERNKRNFEQFNFRLKDNIEKLQIETYREDITKKVTSLLKQDLDGLRPKLQKAVLTWSGKTNYAELFKVKAGGEAPMIEGSVAKFDARASFFLKETKGFREVVVDYTKHEDMIGGKTSRIGRQKQHGHRWIDAARKLAMTANKDRLRIEQPICSVKVALIDDGVTPGQLNPPGALKDGWPLPGTRKLGSSRPFYSSEKGHGTKMARLIQMMCPFVSLYVAKVDIYKDNDSSVATSAAKAIEWAIEKDVDIISMSWTIKRIKSGHGKNQKAIDSLELAIQKAAHKNIIIVCAVQDSAHYGNDDIFPQKSDTKKLMIVGSADENGDRSKFVNEKSFDYLFPGEVFVPEILAATDVGSSVATAIAAGMAAMVLWCTRYYAIVMKNRNDSALLDEQGDASRGNTTTGSTTTATTGETPRTDPWVSETWDFRLENRMNALFDELKLQEDRFVDITSLINRAFKNLDDIQDLDDESDITYTEIFIRLCWQTLPLKVK
ncbi:hypothetical protein V8C37DRAFT_420236 [Trichoderma ceciliae]